MISSLLLLSTFFDRLDQNKFPPRPKLELKVGDDGWVHQQGRDDVAFLERSTESLNLVSSGTGESHLLSGF